MGTKNKKTKPVQKKVMTEKAVTANQQNALKSTGPTSDIGKQASSENNIKHGILSSRKVLSYIESQEEWEEHLENLVADLHPYGSLEMNLVERIADTLWRLRRLVNYDNMLQDEEIKEAEKNKINLKSWYQLIYKNPDKYLHKNKTAYENLLDALNDAKIAVEAFEKIVFKNGKEKIPSAYAISFISMILDSIYFDLKSNDKEVPDTSDDLIDVESIVPNFYNEDTQKTNNNLIKIINALCDKFNLDYEELYNKGSEMADIFLQISQESYDTMQDIMGKHVANRYINDRRCEVIYRLEAQLNRQLMQTLHELQRLQAMRIGISGPPEAIDVIT